MQMAGFPMLRRHCGVSNLVFYRAAPFLFIIGLGSLVNLNAAVAEAPPRQRRLGSPNVLRTFDTEKAHIRQFNVAENAITFTLWKKDSTVVTVFNLDSHELLRLAQPLTSRRKFGGAQLSKDGKTLLVSEAVSFESWNQKVYGIEDSLCFELKSSPILLSSPTGRYFCTTFDEILDKPLSIYDRRGNEIKRFKRPRSWNCRFLDDERLLVVDPDTARIISAITGHQIRAFPLAMDSHFPPSIPNIAVSGSDSLIAIYTDRSILLLSANGKELWRRDFDEYLITAIFDDQAAWVALVLEVPGGSGGLVRVISSKDPNVAIESSLIRNLVGNATRYFDVSWFPNPMIMIWGPVSTDLWFLRPDIEYWTMFVQFDEESLTLSQPMTVPGLYRPIGQDQGEIICVWAMPSGTVALVAIEPNDGEDRK